MFVDGQAIRNGGCVFNRDMLSEGSIRMNL